ncbi:DUF1611 domain-containing protein [Elongatibacter sediminis]|uniref:DUF1611 domain-containing protein n=1 Tax=Elongatibacter sediminis TaxID=3119006 RepID=A0AAW9RNZ5_9GAMM
MLFLGEESNPKFAKTATGIHYWRPELCGGVYHFAKSTLDYGLPVMDVQEAADSGLKTMIIGVAPPGGKIQDEWISILTEALRAGLDLAAGLHTRLNDVPELADAARTHGRTIYDVRQPRAQYPVGTGRKRSGMRLLTVGTECGVGKKYTALAIEREMRQRGQNGTFRATGQTGIMIAGQGVCIDAVVADFVSGAAETLSPDNDSSHWDIIEGQGSLFHPSYACVALGLLHGSQPDAIVLCHDASRREVIGLKGYVVPELAHCIEVNLQLARLTNPNVTCKGVSINTSCMEEDAAADYLAETSGKLGLPAVDPVRFGVRPIVDEILNTSEPVARPALAIENHAES